MARPSLIESSLTFGSIALSMAIPLAVMYGAPVLVLICVPVILYPAYLAGMMRADRMAAEKQGAQTSSRPA